MGKKAKWVVYIVQARSGKLYTGITNDLERRFKEHQSRNKGARFFHFSSPESIVYQEKHPNRSKASKREAQIKKLSRKQKLNLIPDLWSKKVEHRVVQFSSSGGS